MPCQYIFGVSNSKSVRYMKANIYIVLILICSFSFSNAQSNTKEVEVENVKDFSIIGGTIITMDDLFVTDAETKTLDKETLKEDKNATNVARNVSDIRIYLNRVRKVHHLKLLFPKIDAAQMA